MRNTRRSNTAEIDWPQVHARLAQAMSRTQEVFNPSPERVKLVLEERARRLARPLTEHRAGAWLELLAFRLSGERYAVETRHALEVVRSSGLTPIPGAPEVVAGVANLRGQILAVFDLRSLLGLARNEESDSSRIVICGTGEPDLGILVDAVDDVVRLPADAVQAGAAAGDCGERAIILGVTRDATIVLDGAALLKDRRLFVDRTSRQ